MKNKLIQIIYLIFNVITDFIYLLNLLLEIKVNKKEFNEYYIKELKVLLQFLGRSYDKSVFEYHNLNNEEYLFSYYYSLKYKHNSFFKVLCLVYSFTIEYFFIPLLEILNKKLYHKFIDLYEPFYNRVILKKIKNN